jgi:hypothetical protein
MQKLKVKRYNVVLFFSNPTPLVEAAVQNQIWQRVNGNQEFMEIGENLSTGTHPGAARMATWKDLEARFANF